MAPTTHNTTTPNTTPIPLPQPAPRKRAGRGTKEKSAPVALTPLELGRIVIPVISDTPLIVHAWSEKAKQIMIGVQNKEAKQKKGKRNPAEEYEACFYRFPKGAKHPQTEYAFPASAFKNALVSACGRFTDTLKMTQARGAFHIEGWKGTDLVPIFGDPVDRTDMVRVGMGSADIRYRPEFPVWETALTITYIKSVISVEQLVSLIDYAGFSVGIGDWRPERNGDKGRFHLNTSVKLQVLK